jgi:hypothetical protein
MAEFHSTEEDAAATSAAKTWPATGKHQRSLMTATHEGCYQEEHHLPRTSTSENQQDTPIIVLKSDIVESTSPAPVILSSEQREKEGDSEAVVEPSFGLDRQK